MLISGRHVSACRLVLHEQESLMQALLCCKEVPGIESLLYWCPSWTKKVCPCLHLRTLFLLEVVLAKNKVCPSEVSGSDMLAVESGGRVISQGPGFYYKGDAVPLFIHFSSVGQSSPTLCDPMECSMPGFPVHHQLLELTQTHVHLICGAIQPSQALLSPSPTTFNLPQHQGLSQGVSSHGNCFN